MPTWSAPIVSAIHAGKLCRRDALLHQEGAAMKLLC